MKQASESYADRVRKIIKQNRAVFMKTVSRTITIIAILAFATCALQGSLVLVDLGLEKATADKNFSLPTATDTPAGTPTTRTWYSATTPLVATGGGYTGPNIYGALQAHNEVSGPVNFTSALVDDRTSSGKSDLITTRLNSTSEGDIVQGLLFFKKENFANLSSATITFDSTSSANMAVGSLKGAGGNRGARLAVQDGSSWYVSSAYFNGSSGSVSIPDLSVAMFASYDPTVAPLGATPTSFTKAGSTFTDIQAVGYYFYLGTTSAVEAGLDLSSFNITAVPEPATLGLIASAGALLLVFQCRKNR